MPGYGQFCSVARAHEVLGGRWTLLIVRELMCGSRRFNDIRRGVPRVSRTVLSERLQELVHVYYDERGWNREGIPTVSTLKHLGLWPYLTAEAKDLIRELGQ